MNKNKNILIGLMILTGLLIIVFMIGIFKDNGDAYLLKFSVSLLSLAFVLTLYLYFDNK